MFIKIIQLRSEAKSLVLLTPDTGKNLRSILSSGYDHGRNEGDDDELIKEFIRDNGYSKLYSPIFNFFHVLAI